MTFLNGGAGADLIRGGTGDGDLLLGEGGNDYLYDHAGVDDVFNGGAGDDTMRDLDCDYAGSTGGADYDLWYPCATPPPNSIESTAPLFSLTCP